MLVTKIQLPVYLRVGQSGENRQKKPTNNNTHTHAHKKLQLKRKKVVIQAASRWGPAGESLNSTNITLVTARILCSLHRPERNKTKSSKLLCPFCLVKVSLTHSCAFRKFHLWFCFQAHRCWLIPALGKYWLHGYNGIINPPGTPD